MKFKYLFFIVFVVTALVGCYTEKDIVPTEGDEQIYSLPQGNHDYDKDIVSWWNQYGFYTVYIYDIGDLYWANTGWDQIVRPGLGGRLIAEQADPDYVGQMLELFEEFFLDYYPEDWLRECMPLKVFLCSELWDVSWKQNTSEFGDSTRLWVHAGYDHIAINGASQEIDTIDEAMKTEFMREMNKTFFHILINEGKMEMPQAFMKVSNYTYYPNLWPPSVNDFTASDPFGSNNIFKQGYLNIHTVKEGNKIEQSQLNDFYYYVDLVMSYSLAELEAEAGGWANNQSNDIYLNYKGLLNSKRGFTKIRQKYDIIVNYIQNDLGINLDRIRFPERFVTGEE